MIRTLMSPVGITAFVVVLMLSSFSFVAWQEKRVRYFVAAAVIAVFFYAAVAHAFYSADPCFDKGYASIHWIRCLLY